MVRTNWTRIVFERSLIPLNSLLLFFILFEPRIVLPQWLQVFGRMHPLALHFPIVLIILFAVMMLFFTRGFRTQHWYISAMKALLLAAAVTASITALMGFALSGGEDYDADSLALHKWSGVLVPFLLHLMYAFRNRIIRSVIGGRVVAISLTALVSVAGHYGATITHGENFLLAPLTPVTERVLPAFEDAYVYADLVQPILDRKCVSCHNTNKSKGELAMETRELFLKGGEEGIPWDTTKEDLGVMMRRIHMPLEEKEHMPPKGKPQLTDEEVLIIHEWVKRGANFDAKFTDLSPNDTLYAIGKNTLPSASEERYDFAAASESMVQDLNSNYRVIAPIATESPALSATFYNKASFKMSMVNDLAPIKDKIVELNLAGMNVKDEDLAAISQFRNLRELNLNFTEVTGSNLHQLQSLPHLKSISLSGTAVEADQLRKLQDFPKLKNVYLWSTPAAVAKVDELNNRNKNITWHTGFTGDTVTLQLTPPILENEERIVQGTLDLKLKHYIKGTDVRYTLDGSDPDSIKSPVYSPAVKIDSNVTLKAKAFKPGWISSEILERHFYKKTLVPDSVKLLTQPNEKYAASRGASLNDNIQSDMNAGSGKWVGFDKNRFEALFRFPDEMVARNVTFSMYEDLGAWIFPPKYIQVWGGSEPGNLKLLKTYTPTQPKELRPRSLMPMMVEFPPTKVKYLKIVAQPVTLPSWHDEKGKRGYFFVDEVFIN